MNNGNIYKGGLVRKYLYISIVIALIVFVGLVSFFGLKIYTDYLEIHEIGEQFVSIFLKNIFMKSVVGSTSFLFVFLILFFSTKFIKLNLKKANVYTKILDNNVLFLLAIFVVSLFQSLLLSEGLYKNLLLCLNGVPFYMNDPILGVDLSYFVFQRPFLNMMLDTINGILIFVFLYTIILYFMLYIKIGERNINDFLNCKPIMTHIISLILIFLFIKSFSMIIDAQEIFTGQFMSLTGGGFVDINILFRAYTFAAPVLVVIVSVITLFFLAKRKYKSAIITCSAYVAFFVVINIFAWVTQVVYVSPNEVVAEEKFIDYNINYTRFGYNLSSVEEYEYQVSEASDIDLSDEQISNIRIIDFPATVTATNQLQGLRSYYYFKDMDVGVYNINGKKEAVAIGAREIAKENLDESARNYLNEKFRFTHGFGVSMAKINNVTPKGQPDYLIEDLIQMPKEGVPQVTQPRIYFGQMTNDSVIVNTKIRELDYSEGTTDVEFDYDGPAGLNLNFFNKLLFSFKTGDFRMLVASQITPKSRILLNRNILERVTSVAPFFKYDQNPVIVIDDDGTLKWVIDGYTTSSQIPYSQYKNGYNYIRNSFKVVVDAYTGDVQFYIIDKTDPIVLTYQKIYPDLFNGSDIPMSILAKSKYPESLFKTQCEIYTQYHITNPTIFYNKNDMYSIANEKYAQDLRQVEPYYNIMQLDEFNSDEAEMILMLPFTLTNRENMVSWIGVGNEGDNYGKLVAYKFPKNYTVYGPLQIENMIDNDPEISKEMTLWNSGGSNVIRGNLLVLPINNTILYVEPVYITSENQASLPLLKRVIVGCGDEIVMAETLKDALYQLAGVDLNYDEPETIIDSSTEEIATPQKNSISDVVEAYSALENASKNGDWEAFGKAMNDLKIAVSKLSIPDETGISQKIQE